MIGFVHVPNLDPERVGPRGGPFILSKLGLLERTTFGDLLLDAGRDTASNLRLAEEILRYTHTLRVVVTVLVHDADPVETADRIARLDHASGGRVALALEAGRSPEAETLSHAVAFGRADEFAVLVKRLWSNERPITFEGEFYRCADALAPVKGPQGARIPIWTSGLTGRALQMAGRHADFVRLHPTLPEEIPAQLGRIAAVKLQYGRRDQPRYVLPVGVGAQETGEFVKLPEQPGEAAVLLARYARAGVTDFAVHGLDGHTAIAGFSWQVAPRVRDIAQEAGMRLVHPPGTGFDAEAFKPALAR